ncbi:hypothetical protein LVD13_05380 [Flavobacteriaceae bacterium D16]|nr:hypothetical protein [Flavobacteriaceae bacterium D16]
MKKLLSFIFAASLLLVSCEKDQGDSQNLNSVDGKAKAKTMVKFDMDGCSGAVRDLVAGRDKVVVGSITVAEDGDNYVITYNITDEDYCLTEAHVDVADVPMNFEMTNSYNPKIGNFDYVKDDIDCTNEYTVTVANTGTWLAVHGVVVCSTDSPETVLGNLPDMADFCTTVQGPDSYLNISIAEGPLAGDYEAWCIDNDASISINSCYNGASLYSSTGMLPEGEYEYPENFDKVNYLLNQSIVGEACPSGGVYTYGDLQMAIWMLLDDITTGSTAGLGDYSEDCVNNLLTFAEEGEGFTPDCGDIVGVIVDGDGIQPLIIPFPLECAPCDETIWAVGCDFPGNSWAMYFEFYSDN